MKQSETKCPISKDDSIINKRYAFRYFFEFSDDDMYCVVSIVQFLIGKLYEVTILTAVASGLGKTLLKKKTEE